ncbi:MAG: hypothetical protein ACRDNP_13900 [Gaiellaceae bacterium]
MKWAWNADNGEEVWRVSSPGDGLPSHTEQLKTVWGREPKVAEGDVLGIALYDPSGGGTGAVVIDVYYGAYVPKDIARWFRDAFPDAVKSQDVV